MKTVLQGVATMLYCNQTALQLAGFNQTMLQLADCNHCILHHTLGTKNYGVRRFVRIRDKKYGIRRVPKFVLRSDLKTIHHLGWCHQKFCQLFKSEIGIKNPNLRHHENFSKIYNRVLMSTSELIRYRNEANAEIAYWWAFGVPTFSLRTLCRAIHQFFLLPIFHGITRIDPI